jgi:hypothetical protein
MLFRRKNTAANVALPPLSACDANTVALAALLHEVPEKNVAQLAEHLLQVCNELRSGDASKTQWVAALQVLQPHITVVAEALASNEPSDIKRLENYRLQLRFFSDFGQLLSSTAASIVNVKSRDKHATSPQNYHSQAIKFLARSLLLSAKLYASPVSGCWQALHHSYQSLQKFDTKDDSSNALNYYKAIVALYCLNPQQCDLETINLLFELLVAQSKHIAFAKKPCKQTVAIFNLEEDKPPLKFQASDKGNAKAGRHSYYVNINALSAQWPKDDNYRVVNQHLTKVLSVTSIRDTQRDETGSAFNLCAGIFAIHKKLSGLASFDDYILHYPGTVAQRAPEFAEKKSVNRYKPNDIWSTPYQTNWAKLMGSEKNAVNVELRAAAPSADQTYLKQDVTCVNAVNCSLFGLCVHGNSQPLSSYTPGTLLGLQKNTADNWSVASVRWTRADMQQRQLGIEIIGQQATPCAIKIVHSKHGTDAMPALYIPASATKAALHTDSESEASELQLSDTVQEDWLLFPNTSLSNKTSALLLMDEKMQRIILSKCIEQTSEYCIYALNLVETDDES